MTKRGEQFHTEALAVASFKAVKNGWEGERDNGLEEYTDMTE